MQVTFVVKDMFLDRPAVAKAVGGMNRRSLNHAGALTRKIAKRRIKFRKDPNKNSKPGNSPFAHRRGKGIKTILYGYHAASASVVVGLARLGGTNDPSTTSTLEHGGTARIRSVIGRTGKHKRLRRRGKYATRSEAEKRHIKRYYDSIPKLTTVKTVTIKARPTMGPSLDVAKRLVPSLWKDEFKGTGGVFG